MQGDSYPAAHPSPVECFVDEQRRLIRRGRAPVERGRGHDEDATGGLSLEALVESCRTRQGRVGVTVVFEACDGSGGVVGAQRDNEVVRVVRATTGDDRSGARIDGLHFRDDDLDAATFE